MLPVTAGDLKLTLRAKQLHGNDAFLAGYSTGSHPPRGKATEEWQMIQYDSVNFFHAKFQRFVQLISRSSPVSGWNQNRSGQPCRNLCQQAFLSCKGWWCKACFKLKPLNYKIHMTCLRNFINLKSPNPFWPPTLTQPLTPSFSQALMAHHGLISLAFARLKSLCKYALLTVICSAFFSTVTLQAGNACGSSNKSLAVCGFLLENGSADTSSNHFFIAWSFVGQHWSAFPLFTKVCENTHRWDVNKAS